jgi:hypothetical protein
MRRWAIYSQVRTRALQKVDSSGIEKVARK